MATISSVGSLDEIRRKVIRELVDLELGLGRRRLTRRQQVARGIRASILRFGR
jgi:hypothetical protein